jgi:siroheme synthase
MKPLKVLMMASYGLEPKHITLETLAVLKKCDVVYSDCLDGRKSDFIIKSCRHFESLRGGSPEETVSKVLAAFSASDTVGFVTYGNPFFLNDTAFRIKKKLEAARIKIKVLPAVSSFDSIVNLMDLNEFSRSGLRLVDAAAASVAPGGIAFTPNMDTLFFVVGGFNLGRGKDSRSAFLKGLGKFYPGKHPVSIINCPTVEKAEGRLVNTTVSGLKAALRRADDASTILVHAVK